MKYIEPPSQRRGERKTRPLPPVEPPKKDWKYYVGLAVALILLSLIAKMLGF